MRRPSLVLLSVVLGNIFGCSGNGCSCMAPIPGGYPPAQREPKRAVNPLGRIRRFARQPLGEPGRLLVDELAVQHEQGLLGCGAGGSLVGGDVGVGPVEYRQKRLLPNPLLHYIHGAAIGCKIVDERLVLRVAPFPLPREGMRPARRPIDPPDPQQRAYEAMVDRVSLARCF